MNRPLLPVFAAIAALLSSNGPALAKVDPRFSHADPIIVGDAGRTRAYLVTVRDINGAPQNRRLVTLDFSGSAVRLFQVQEHRHPTRRRISPGRGERSGSGTWESSPRSCCPARRANIVPKGCASKIADGPPRLLSDLVGYS